ncbi:hypothetical protein FACS189444_0190 [Spirochaetia bacterium]|nr:hypothetical protein FACS189444_0190 [Spirochaetia bacterium]
MKLSVDIQNLKSISSLHIDLPVKKDIYAITGQNATGKSTLVAATATVFYNAPMNRYFGKSVDNGTSISFSLNGQEKQWAYNRISGWVQNGHIRIKGFYEGSVIFGNRFKETGFFSLEKMEKVANSDLIDSDPFIRKNLGMILQNDENYYQKVMTINEQVAKDKYGFSGVPYYFYFGNRRISQYHMSTGENLLITILHSILSRINDRKELSLQCLLLLDEIELALHPSSLARLLHFLQKISQDYNMAIYFSTHSIELIREIKPENIFFLDRMIDGSINIVNPCYPSYATKILYDHFGYDTVILVEDDLAKIIVDRLLRKLRLLDNKIVHVMPCGGWTNVLKLASDVVDSNLLSKPSKIITILDGDVESSVPSYINKNNINIAFPVNYLPMQSLEKFLKYNLIQKIDANLYKFLNDYLFQQINLKDIQQQYIKSENSKVNNEKKDNNGKEFYKLLEAELDKRNKTRSDLVELVVEYMFTNSSGNILKTEAFLKKEFS